MITFADAVEKARKIAEKLDVERSDRLARAVQHAKNDPRADTTDFFCDAIEAMSFPPGRATMQKVDDLCDSLGIVSITRSIAARIATRQPEVE